MEIDRNKLMNAKEVIEHLDLDITVQGLIYQAKKGKINHYRDPMKRRNKYLFDPEELEKLTLEKINYTQT